jgi:DNA-binding CsgD family transcriptional regulator
MERDHAIKYQERREIAEQIVRLRSKRLTYRQIGKRLGINPSTLRSIKQVSKPQGPIKSHASWERRCQLFREATRLREEGKKWKEIAEILQVAQTMIYALCTDSEFSRSKFVPGSYVEEPWKRHVRDSNKRAGEEQRPSLIEAATALRQEGKSWKEISIILQVKQHRIYSMCNPSKFFHSKPAVEESAPAPIVSSKEKRQKLFDTANALRKEGKSWGEISRLLGVKRGSIYSHCNYSQLAAAPAEPAAAGAGDTDNLNSHM